MCCRASVIAVLSAIQDMSMFDGERAYVENLRVDVGTQTDSIDFDVGPRTDSVEDFGTVRIQTDLCFDDACSSDGGDSDEDDDDDVENEVDDDKMKHDEMKDDGGGDADHDEVKDDGGRYGDHDGSLMGVVFAHTFVGHGRYTCRVTRDEADDDQVVV